MSETLIQPNAVWMMLAVFGATMIAAVWFTTHSESHADGFLVADRKVPLWRGAFSIAVSWIWAPAIFICSLQAFTKGLPGIFWFTAPNILCFFAFAVLAVKMRRLMPKGYTLPEYIFERFGGSKSTHVLFVIVFLGYQFGAITINSLAGGLLINAVSGVDVQAAIIAMIVISLTYSLLSGLKASIFTDVIQMLMVLGVALVLVPWCFMNVSGVDSLSAGLGGVDGSYRNLFDPWVAFTMGIPMTLGLMAGPVADQMFFQRAMAVEKKVIAKTFIYGGLIFGAVPIALSLLGFIGADLAAKGEIVVRDPQVVGAVVIGHLLPQGALYAFCFMAFAGLCSTMDSAFCAASSLGSVDIYKRYIKPHAQDQQMLRFSRIFMITMAVFGAALALLQPKLLWLFLSYGALSSSVLVPVIFAVYSKRITARAITTSVGLSLALGFPLSIYANVNEDPHLIVFAAIFSVAVGLVTCATAVIQNNRAQKSRTLSFQKMKARTTYI